jgi:hypothetical protein
MGRSKKEVSWDSGGIDVYLGFEPKSIGDQPEDCIYVGGRYYGSTAQIHLSLKEAKWLLRHLPKAIKKASP